MEHRGDGDRVTQKELQEHDRWEYAHAEMRHRAANEDTGWRLGVDQRLSALERFKAQAMLLGAIGFTVLGALAAAVAERFMVHGIP